MGQSKLMMIAHIVGIPFFKQFTAVFGYIFPRQNIFFRCISVDRNCLPYQIALSETMAYRKSAVCCQTIHFLLPGNFRVPGRISNEIIFIAVHQGDRRADHSLF